MPTPSPPNNVRLLTLSRPTEQQCSLDLWECTPLESPLSDSANKTSAALDILDFVHTSDPMLRLPIGTRNNAKYSSIYWQHVRPQES